MNEADTCRSLITPKLRTAGWTDEQIREQVTFTHGRIVPAGGKVARKLQKRADYLLYYQSNYKVAVIEAKDDTYRAVDGLPQAKEYAKMLGLPYAYATNGHEILEFNFKTGELREVDCFPSPEELWYRVQPCTPGYKLVTLPTETPAERDLFTCLARDLEQISLLSGSFHWTSGFVELWDSWCRNASINPPFKDSKFDGYNGRRRVHLMKLSMIHAVSRRMGELVLTEDALQEAISTLNEVEQKMTWSSKVLVNLTSPT